MTECLPLFISTYLKCIGTSKKRFTACSAIYDVYFTLTCATQGPVVFKKLIFLALWEEFGLCAFCQSNLSWVQYLKWHGHKLASSMHLGLLCLCTAVRCACLCNIFLESCREGGLCYSMTKPAVYSSSGKRPQNSKKHQNSF